MQREASLRTHGWRDASQDACLLFTVYMFMDVLTVSLFLVLFFFSQDLKFIYGRYIDPSSEAERHMYVILSQTPLAL